MLLVRHRPSRSYRSFSSSLRLLSRRDVKENVAETRGGGRGYNDSPTLRTAETIYSSGEDPWKTLLEMPARAKWRVSSPTLPRAIEEARKDVLRRVPPQFATLKSKELQRVLHTTIFESHKAMAKQRQRERRQAFYGEDDSNKKKNDHGDNSNSSTRASTLLLPYGPIEAVATLRHRLHPNYEIVKRVLLEAKSLLMTNPSRRPIHRVIDMGCGVGSASIAALEVFGAVNGGGEVIEWVHGIDASRTMQDIAGELWQRYCHHRAQELLDQQGGAAHYSGASPRFTFSSHLSSSSSSSSTSTTTTAASASSFDLALLCYTAAEMPSCASSLAAAALLWDKLSPNGILVVIEPGTPDGFATVRTIRNMLLDCCRPDDDDDDALDTEECHILAPCTHRGKCPMELYPIKPRKGKAHSSTNGEEDVSEDEQSDDEAGTNDEYGDGVDAEASYEDDEEDDTFVAADGGTRRGYCSFVQAMPGSASGGGRKKHKGEKFSYLVVQKRVNDNMRTERSHDERSTLPHFPTDNLTDLLQRTQLSTHVSFEEHSKAIQDALDLEDKYLDSDLDPLGLEFLQSDENRASFGRILHAPIKRKGHVWIDCCTSGVIGSAGAVYADGRIVRHSISKSMSKVAPCIYAAARKSRWGGYWPNLSPSSLDRNPRSDDDE